ncbi:MAG: hypothetical protein ABIT70_07670 [Sulfuriferula sp.]
MPPFFKLSHTTPQSGFLDDVRVIVKGKIRRPDVAKQLLLQLPAATHDRLKAAVLGPQAPGIVGLIEWALEELDRQGKILTIENA